VLADVYYIDAQTRKQTMTPQQRLAYHQKHSEPLMTALKSWLARQINDHLVEPNSGLGKAVTYMIKHWPELTQFLRVAGAPLDNNICERSLKRCIQHRKNSLFYRTEHGAFIGDMFMSLIATCTLNQVNPLDYLIILLENSSALFKDPCRWVPWNYKTNIV
jgi:transposase